MRRSKTVRSFAAGAIALFALTITSHAAATITNLSPSFGTAGTTVTIYGTNFGTPGPSCEVGAGNSKRKVFRLREPIRERIGSLRSR